MKKIAAAVLVMMAVFSNVSFANEHCDKDHHDKEHCK